MMADYVVSDEVREQYPSLFRFEQAVKHKDYANAYRELWYILSKLDAHFGSVFSIQFDSPTLLANLEAEKNVYFCTQLANAITSLFTDPDFVLPVNQLLALFKLWRWISAVFAVSPYVNADHILVSYDVDLSENALVDRKKR